MAMMEDAAARRRFGVNFFSVMRAAKELGNDPNFEPASRTEFAEKILEKIIGQKLPAARQEMPEIDWDALLAFIEKILPLILLLIGGI